MRLSRNVFQRRHYLDDHRTDFDADRAAVEAFHAAALAAGGEDNGAPGYRANIHPDYYAAFVLDPAGNNIEAACMAPQHAKA
jgi:catechol 2,3-dioxygenase-like lactoylglutathione lyase family enzyme